MNPYLCVCMCVCVCERERERERSPKLVHQSVWRSLFLSLSSHPYPVNFSAEFNSYLRGGGCHSLQQGCHGNRVQLNICGVARERGIISQPRLVGLIHNYFTPCRSQRLLQEVQVVGQHLCTDKTIMRSYDPTLIIM